MKTGDNMENRIWFGAFGRWGIVISIEGFPITFEEYFQEEEIQNYFSQTFKNTTCFTQM